MGVKRGKWGRGGDRGEERKEGWVNEDSGQAQGARIPSCLPTVIIAVIQTVIGRLSILENNLF